MKAKDVGQVKPYSRHKYGFSTAVELYSSLKYGFSSVIEPVIVTTIEYWPRLSVFFSQSARLNSAGKKGKNDHENMVVEGMPVIHYPLLSTTN